MIDIIKKVWRTRIALHKNSLHKNSLHKNTELITTTNKLITKNTKLIMLIIMLIMLIIMPIMPIGMLIIMLIMLIIMLIVLTMLIRAPWKTAPDHEASKPMRGVRNGSGGFDSRTPPPKNDHNLR